MWSWLSNMAVLNPAGPVALAERHVIFVTAALCSIVVVPVFFLLFYFAWAYRAGGQGVAVHHAPDWDHDNMWAEFFWWLVPSVIILALGILAWQSSHALDPYLPLASNNPTLNVEVVALDWKWLFIYPEQGIASINMLEIPQETPVHFSLTADAPMNSFWIPQLGGQIMVMPGMETQLNLMASRTGTFSGSSANISGDGFAGMNFTVNSVSQSDFDAWVTSARASTTTLSTATYQTLAAPSEYNAPASFASVDPSLYNSILDKYMTPGMSGMNMTP